MAGPSAPLERLELRVERLRLTFRFTYAFHAREVRFECDRGIMPRAQTARGASANEESLLFRKV